MLKLMHARRAGLSIILTLAVAANPEKALSHLLRDGITMKIIQAADRELA